MPAMEWNGMRWYAILQYTLLCFEVERRYFSDMHENVNWNWKWKI